MVKLAVCLASAGKFEALERGLIDPADTLGHQKTFNRIVNPMAKAEIITSHSFRVSFLTKWLCEMVRLAVKWREGLSIWPKRRGCMVKMYLDIIKHANII